jgi:hypothetical protein
MQVSEALGSTAAEKSNIHALVLSDVMRLLNVPALSESRRTIANAVTKVRRYLSESGSSE